MKDRTWKRAILFFILAYAFTWLFWIPRALLSRGDLHLPVHPMLLHILGAFGPALAAVSLTWIQDGKTGLLRLFVPYCAWRVSWNWYGFVLLTRPLIWLITLLGYIVFHSQRFAWPPLDIGFVTLYFISQLLVVGVGEELGWAGYALPRLRARHGFVKANLILGLLWGLWHLPFFFTIGDSQYGASLFVFVLKLTAFRYLFSLAYMQTGSLVMPGLFHVSFNVLTEQIPLSPNDPWAIGLSTVFTIVLLLIFRARGWLPINKDTFARTLRTVST